jgi:hypothetical protein
MEYTGPTVSTFQRTMKNGLGNDQAGRDQFGAVIRPWGAFSIEGISD